MDKVTFTVVIQAAINYKNPVQEAPKISIVSEPQIPEEKDFGPGYARRFMDIVAWGVAAVLQELRVRNAHPDKAFTYLLKKISDFDSVQFEAWKREKDKNN